MVICMSLLLEKYVFKHIFRRTYVKYNFLKYQNTFFQKYDLFKYAQFYFYGSFLRSYFSKSAVENNFSNLLQLDRSKGPLMNSLYTPT